MEMNSYDYLEGLSNPDIVTIVWDHGMKLKVETIRHLTPAIFSIKHYGKTHTEFNIKDERDLSYVSPRFVTGTIVIMQYLGFPENLKQDLKVLHEMFPNGKVTIGKETEF